MPNSERPTMPPTKADEAAGEFEMYVREQGESQARWVRLMALLAASFGPQAQSEAA